MKVSLTVLIIVLSIPLILSGQGNSPGSGTDCESLIFNTSELTPFEFNERCRTESYPFISSDGTDLYFTHSQTIDWIFYSQKEKSTGKWTVPVPLKIAGFSAPIRSCFLLKDLSTIYFISGEKLYRSKAIEGSRTEFQNAEMIDIVNTGDNAVKGPLSYLSFTADMNFMYAYVNNPDNLSNMCLYMKSGDNAYVFVKVVSTTSREMGYLSEDGKVYYFTNDDLPNVLFCKKRNDLKEDFGSTIYKVKTFEPQLRVSQIRMSENSDGLVMVLSDNFWNRNDIYFMDFNCSDTARNYMVFEENLFRVQGSNNKLPDLFIKDVANTTPTIKREVINTKGAEMCKIEIGHAFPNPAKNTFFFYYDISTDNPQVAQMPVFSLMDNSGRVVYTKVLDDFKGEADVVLEDVPSGAYMFKIEYNGFSSELIRINVTM